MLAALPADLDGDFRRSLKNIFKYLHEYSLRKRLGDLARRFPLLLAAAIGDVKAFGGIVADERNRLTHLDATTAQVERRGRDQWVMAEFHFAPIPSFQTLRL